MEYLARIQHKKILNKSYVNKKNMNVKIFA